MLGVVFDGVRKLWRLGLLLRNNGPTGNDALIALYCLRRCLSRPEC
jgi:hypothetical protein